MPVALAGNAVFLPAIGMGTGATWGAAGIQGAPRVERALFFPFFLSFPPAFGSSNVQTLLVQEEPWDCPHATREVTPVWFIRDSPVLHHLAQVPLPVGASPPQCRAGAAAVTALGPPPLEGGIAEQCGMW